MINLLTDHWLPMNRAGKGLDWVAPHQIGEPDIIAFAARRPDFNGALAQFMIGLLQTAALAGKESEWRKRFDTPPSSSELMDYFAPFADAFIMDGSGARFMQDVSLDETAECGIDGLLIDAAGASSIDKNTDLFVKRGTVSAMCPHCAATALFTLQTNAPAGGAGHRTSLRGGGPLTTLAVATPTRSLWHDLWLNVLPARTFLARGGDTQKSDPVFTFPWLDKITTIQPPGAETQPLQVHPYHVFWAMPRRIRLDFSDLKTGQCSICKRESTELLERYATKPQGLNYKGPWRHPLSPYYETKEGWLPVHPQPGGFSYRHWLAWAVGATGSKRSVDAAANATYVAEERQSPEEMRLWVFGFDMNNMQARCWYETTFPLYALVGVQPLDQQTFKVIAGMMIDAAEQVVFYLRQAIKQARFGNAEIRGDLSFVDKMFWDSTDGPFFQRIRGLIAQAKTEIGLGDISEEYLASQLAGWYEELCRQALRLFDTDITGAGPIAGQDPRRTAQAYQGLRRNLNGTALRSILGLPKLDDGQTDKRKSGKTPPAQPS